jgi:hypothetical protein
MCENRLLRRMFGPEREEENCRKLRNEGLHFLLLIKYQYDKKARNMKREEHITRMGSMRNACRR